MASNFRPLNSMLFLDAYSYNESRSAWSSVASISEAISQATRVSSAKIPIEEPMSRPAIESINMRKSIGPRTDP